MKKEVWVCVDKDGTEMIREGKPKRFYGTQKELETERLSYETISKKDIWISDYDHISEKDFPKIGITPKIIFLPHGTIEKILGHKLTWNDEAVKI